MPKPAVARIWEGRTPAGIAEFKAISYWGSRDEIRAYAGDDIEKTHHLPKTKPSVRNLRSAPTGIARAGAGECRRCIQPSVARVASGTQAHQVEQTFASGVEAEKTQQRTTLPRVQRLVAANELVVDHAAIHHGNCTPRLDSQARAGRQAGPEHYRIEEIALQPQVLRHGPVIERAR